jgi:hypothetical protein
MVFHGKGFTWTELYEMPVWLRKFYYRKMEEYTAKQKEHQLKQSKKSQKPKISKPIIGAR